MTEDRQDLSLRRWSSRLPSALVHLEEICSRYADRGNAIFLDYDGTLTSIVERPDEALLPEEVRKTLESLASKTRIAVVSGRDLRDVRKRVGLRNIFYAGSHGFEIEGPNGHRFEHDQAAEVLPVLDEVEKVLEERLQPIEGAEVERKRFSIAVHYRRVVEDAVGAVQELVKGVGGRYPRLRLGAGKKVIELQPNVAWDKGKALLWIMDALGFGPDGNLSLYMGDDITDEDAFSVLLDSGIGIVVHRKPPKLTFAGYVLADTGQVGAFLDGLNRRLPTSDTTD